MIKKQKRKKRGRPVGMKLSEKSKREISKSKMGQKHDDTVKRKISAALRKYYTTPEGKRHKEALMYAMKDFWGSDEGALVKSLMSTHISLGIKKYKEDNPIESDVVTETVAEEDLWEAIVAESTSTF